MRSIYSLVWGRCSNAMQAKVMANPGYDLADKQCDCVWFLQQIKSVMSKFEGEKQIFHANTEARARLEELKQKDSESPTSFLEQFQATIEAFEHYGGSIGNDKGLIAAVAVKMQNSNPGEYDKTTTDADVLRAWTKKDRVFRTSVEKVSRDRSLAMSFLYKSDRAKYGQLWFGLHNRHSLGKDEYLNNLSEAYTVLSNFKKEKGDKHKSKNKNKDNVYSGQVKTTPAAEAAEEEEVGVNFLQNYDLIPGTDGIVHNIVCYNCNQSGHYAHQCPSQNTPRRSSADASPRPTSATVPITQPTTTGAGNTDVGTSLLQALTSKKDESFDYEIMFHQGSTTIPDHWILLDSQSTTCVFKNKHFLKNIRKSKKTLHLITNGGTHTSTLVGDLGNFGSVWYTSESLANILSLAAVRRKCRVTMDTKKEVAMIVHRNDGTQMKFKEFRTGLYYHDPSEPNSTNKNKSTVSSYCLVQTVANNKKCSIDARLKEQIRHWSYMID